MVNYNEYKNVKMGWLDRIPAHWTTVSLKYSIGKNPFSFVDGDWIESKVIESDGIRYLTTGNVGIINYKEQGNGFISDKTFKELNCTEVFPGDVLISRLNFPIGRSCIVPNLGYRIVVAVDNVIFRPDETKYNKKYLVYQMNCYPYSENANFIARGSTMQRITRTQLGALKLCVPPLEEQNAMVTYLDKKCSEIDKVISAQQKRIALLLELKQSVITHAVTKGLNPNVEMKDSGVEWIGKVPKHWEICKLKHVSSLYGRIGFRGYNQTDLVSEGEGAITLSPSNMQNGTMDYNKCSFLSWKKYYESPEIMIKDGDILFVKTGSTYGKTSLVNKLPMEATINPQIVVFKDIKVNNHFLYYLLTNDIVQMQVSLTVGGSTIPTLSQDNILNYVIPIAPKNEQDEIANYLDKKCESIDSSISKAQHQVELLQEYKQSLITEVVTGKRKVS